MDSLLNAALSNALAAAVLAVLAVAVGRACRRPAVSHALWLLVLLKLLTPPLVDVPVPWPVAPPAAEPETIVVTAPDEDVSGATLDDPPEAVLVPVAPDAEEPLTVVAEPPAPAVAAAPLAWRGPVALAWLAGAAAWLALTAVRGRRFARLLRYGRKAPAWLQAETDRLAKRLGLASSPAVLLLPGRVAPMVWSLGASARLLLPRELLARLDDDGRQALLAHELAHLRRRDHRVRLFEALTTALYWWHPVVWWARRELREAEEQCCDAWVLWALPGAAKCYALTLVETVDFLSESRAPLPALASGFGTGDDLRRRVTMIMQGSAPRSLSWGGLLGVLGLGAFLLPVVPIWGQEPQEEKRVIRLKTADGEKKAAEEKKVIVVNEIIDVLNGIELADEKEAASGERRINFRLADGDDAARLKQDLEKMRAEVEKKRAELSAVEARLKAFAQMAAERARATAAGAALRGKVAAAGAKEEKEKTRAHAIRIEIRDGDNVQQIVATPGKTIKLPDGRQIRVIVVGQEGAAEKGATEGTLRIQTVPAEAPPRSVTVTGRVRTATDEADKKLAEMEKKLAEMMRELQMMRSTRNRPGAVPPPPAPRAPSPPASLFPGEPARPGAAAPLPTPAAAPLLPPPPAVRFSLVAPVAPAAPTPPVPPAPPVAPLPPATQPRP